MTEDKAAGSGAISETRVTVVKKRSRKKARTSGRVTKSTRSCKSSSPKVKRLDLKRPIVVIDIETTGLSVKSDRIVEFCGVKIHPDGSRETRTHRINPEKTINSHATQVHGISNSDLADCPTFAKLADELLGYLSGCDLSGFNIEQFDLKILTNEFARVNITFPPTPVHVLDTLRIYTKYESRTLRNAYRFYCNSEIKDAHSAQGDAMAAADILQAQVQRYEDMPNDVAAVEDLVSPQRVKAAKIDPEGRIVWRMDKAVLTFGQYRNCSLQHVAQTDVEYLQWITRSGFSSAVTKIVQAAVDGVFPSLPVTCKAATA